jgi:hypothetical protein
VADRSDQTPGRSSTPVRVPPPVWVRRCWRVASVPGDSATVVTHPGECVLRVLTDSAAVVWGELEEGSTVDGVIERVRRHYPEDDPTVVGAGVRAFLDDLVATGLAEYP